MDLGEPIRSVIPAVTGSVLAALARARQPMTGGELERQVKPAASHRGVQNAVAGLVAAGIVDRVDKGRSALYSLNRDHVSAPAVELLATMRDELLERIRAAVRKWKVPARSVTLFGSLARGDAGGTSDIDLLVVRPDSVHYDNDTWSRQLAELGNSVRRWSGNPLRPIVLSDSELADAFRAAEPYLMAATTEGLTMFGAPLRRLRVTATK